MALGALCHRKWPAFRSSSYTPGSMERNQCSSWGYPFDNEDCTIRFLEIRFAPNGKPLEIEPRYTFKNSPELKHLAGDSRTHYYLYTDDSFSILPKRHFNQAMSALLTCAKELGNFMEKCDPVLQYPYEMSSNKLNSLSGLHTSDEETWTRAMKFLLTNIKWAVVWVAKHITENAARP